MPKQTVEQQMQEVIDREAIRGLPVQYCHCVWQKDLDGYVALFTEDGSFSTDDPDLPGAEGHSGLRGMISSGLKNMQPRPFIHNHVVELLGPHDAKGTCYVEVHMNRHGQKWEMKGWYNDKYTKVDGEWKFKSRQITTDSFGPAKE